jgi:hypothetical protein
VVIKPFTLLVAGLAGQRAAQAISADKVTQPVRDRVLLWSMDDKQTSTQYERRAKIAQFIHCPHCTGFWLSAVTLAMYSVVRRYPRNRTARGMSLVVEWWAVASIQTMLTAAWAMFSDVAHHAEVETKLAEAELLKQRQAHIPPS